MPNNEEWYFCQDCNRHFTDKTQLNECLKFGHYVKRRMPIEKRLVYTDIGFGVPKILDLTVDDDVWKVEVRLFVFRTSRNIQGKNTTRFLTKVGLSPDIKNMVNHLNHLFSDLKLTTKQLTSLLENAIRKGVYEEAENGVAIIYLCLDSWMQLKPKNNKSKLICTTYAKFSKLKKTNSEVLRKIKV